MDIEIIKLCAKRIVDYIVPAVIISVIMVLLNHSGIADNKKVVKIMLSLGVILFAVENIRMLRGCYYSLKNDRIYLLVNIFAYTIFALITFILYWFIPKSIFTWLFAVMRFGEFVFEPMKALTSIFVFHVIQFIIIFLAPIGMSWVYRDLMTFED